MMKVARYLSRSDAVDRLKADATATAAQLEQLPDRTDLSPEDVRAIVSAATRLYANASTQAGLELPPLTPDVSTTDAVTLACALIRSHNLTPFDMAMWFGRGARHP
jgi:hypothetical protein